MKLIWQLFFGVGSALVLNFLLEFVIKKLEGKRHKIISILVLIFLLSVNYHLLHTSNNEIIRSILYGTFFSFFTHIVCLIKSKNR